MSLPFQKYKLRAYVSKHFETNHNVIKAFKLFKNTFYSKSDYSFIDIQRNCKSTSKLYYNTKS